MKKYELIVIYSAQLGESQVKEKTDKIQAALAKNGAQDIVADSWGKRPIAFEMNQSNHGTYQVFYFESEESDLNDKMNALLRIEEGIIKFQTHRIQEQVRKFRGRTDRPAEQPSA